jgi:ubiquinol-cytochrome c reductase cytochrome b subunit
MVVTLVFHLAQTYFWGAYKGRRELLWLSGLILFALVIGMAFTGYLLPWDQKAYFATAVGTNIAGEMPIIGDWLKRLMRGGTEMGTLTLSRFFVAHVFLIPGCIFAFVGTHVFLFRKAGSAGPIKADPIDPKMKTEQFYPRQVIYDIVFATILIGILGLLSYLWPAELGPRANPADTQFVPRPEWYYLPIFQWLKYWSGPYVVIGIVAIPAIIIGFLALLPFYDRDNVRKPWKRPIAIVSFLLILGSLVFLGMQSGNDDSRDPATAKQLAKQTEETASFMKAPFQPEIAGATLAAQNVQLADPLAAKGKKIYADNSCDGCHGDNGGGTDGGPKLTDITAKYDHDKLLNLMKNPTQKMKDGNMDPVDLPDEQMNALLSYLNSLK